MLFRSYESGRSSESLECAHHVLVECSLAQSCGVHQASFGNISDLLNFASNGGRCSMKRKILMVICYCMLPSPSMVTDNIISTVYCWVKYRRNLASCNWID
uniref:Uncharacterized protein n=1 Tax=Lactuca sativa TaxID=4236 RepID=A0A9R1XW68_LACSA|nr:hypothetical protein LSAT_V11C200054650 [Lactuca sativa]